MAEGEKQLSISHVADYIRCELMPSANAGEVAPHIKPDVVIDEAELGSMLQGLTLQGLKQQVQHSIIASYRACDNNVSRCATQLGISRNTLYHELKALGLK